MVVGQDIRNGAEAKAMRKNIEETGEIKTGAIPKGIDSDVNKDQ
jgi:hypothetical protein